MAATYLQTGTANNQVKKGFGKLKGIFISSGTNPTVAVYDTADGTTSGTTLISVFTAAVPSNYVFVGDEGGVNFSKGLYVVLGGTTPIGTVFYE